MVNMSGSKRARQQDSIKNKPTCGGDKKSGLMRFTGMDSSISFSRFGIKSDTRPVYGMNCPGNFSVKRNQTCAGGVGKHVTMRHCGNGDGSSGSLSNQELIQLILTTLANGGRESDILDIIIQNIFPNSNLPVEDNGIGINNLVKNVIDILTGDRYIPNPVPDVDDKVKNSTYQCQSYSYDPLLNEMTIEGAWIIEDSLKENFESRLMFQIRDPITVNADKLTPRGLYFLQSKLVNFCSISNTISLPVAAKSYADDAANAIENFPDLFFAVIELMAIAHSIPVYTNEIGMSSAWVVNGGTTNFCHSLYTQETLTDYIVELDSLICSLLAPPTSSDVEWMDLGQWDTFPSTTIQHPGDFSGLIQQFINNLLPSSYGDGLNEDSEFYFVQNYQGLVTTAEPFNIQKFSGNETDSIEDGWEPIKLELMIELFKSRFEITSTVLAADAAAVLAPEAVDGYKTADDLSSTQPADGSSSQTDETLSSQLPNGSLSQSANQEVELTQNSLDVNPNHSLELSYTDEQSNTQQYDETAVDGQTYSY